MKDYGLKVLACAASRHYSSSCLIIRCCNELIAVSSFTCLRECTVPPVVKTEQLCLPFLSCHSALRSCDLVVGELRCVNGLCRTPDIVFLSYPLSD